MIVCVLAGAVIAFAMGQSQSPQYTASASVLFRDLGIDQGLVGVSAFAPSIDQPSQAATNIVLASLPIVASRTAAALHLTTSAVTSAVSISGIGQANVAQVNATESDPQLAARIANAYAKQYVLFRQRADRAEISAAQQLVQKQLSALPAAQRQGRVGQGLRARANDLMQLEALQTGNAEVVQPAAIPSSPSGPHAKRDGIIGGLVGLLLGIGLAFLAERLDQRIREPSELEDAYGFAMLGAIPFSPEAAGSDEPQLSVIADAFGLVRARLRYFNVDHDVRSLLVTSALPAEGKTTAALNLAIAEAIAGNAKTVLVEADLRSPTLERRLALDRGPGLAEVLSRNATIDRATRRVHIRRPGAQNGATAGFSVVTAGTVPPNPVELLESRAMIDLLTALSEQYDLVIVDSPPPSVVPDAIPLMQLVNGVVVVGRKGIITRHAARQLREQLLKLNAPALGVIANGMRDTSYGYRNYRYFAHEAEAVEASSNGTKHVEAPERSRAGLTEAASRIAAYGRGSSRRRS
jgi:receptor protein-tyrosine kinase